MIERISYPKGQKRYKTPMILRSLCGKIKNQYIPTPLAMICLDKRSQKQKLALAGE
jgi:hypothetical protein